MFKKSSIVALGLILLIAAVLLADSDNQPGERPRLGTRTQASPGATFTVTTTADAGAGSLRAAIIAANGSPGWDIINFNIPGAGVQTIFPLSQLPALTDPQGVPIFPL